MSSYKIEEMPVEEDQVVEDKTEDDDMQIKSFQPQKNPEQFQIPPQTKTPDEPPKKAFTIQGSHQQSVAKTQNKTNSGPITKDFFPQQDLQIMQQQSRVASKNIAVTKSGPGTTDPTNNADGSKIKYFSSGPFVIKRNFAQNQSQNQQPVFRNSQTQKNEDTTADSLRGSKPQTNHSPGLNSFCQVDSKSMTEWNQTNYNSVNDSQNIQAKKKKRGKYANHISMPRGPANEQWIRKAWVSLSKKLKDDRNFIFSSQEQFVFNPESGYAYPPKRFNKHQRGIGNNSMIPQSLNNRAMLKEIIAHRNYQSSMTGAVQFYLQELENNKVNTQKYYSNFTNTPENSTKKVDNTQKQNLINQRIQNQTQLNQPSIDGNISALSRQYHAQPDKKQNTINVFSSNEEEWDKSAQASDRKNFKSFTHRSLKPKSFTRNESKVQSILGGSRTSRAELNVDYYNYLSLSKNRKTLDFPQTNYIQAFHNTQSIIPTNQIDLINPLIGTPVGDKETRIHSNHSPKISKQSFNADLPFHRPKIVPSPLGPIESQSSLQSNFRFEATSNKFAKIINKVQHESPSGKFQTKLMEKEKQHEFEQMSQRVHKLEIDQERAQKQLMKTMQAHDRAEQIAKRKFDDLEFKKQWLSNQNMLLQDAKERNNLLREERKKNISLQRQKVLYQNIMARENKKSQMQEVFNTFQQISSNELMNRDTQVAQVYSSKKQARDEALSTFTENLIKIRNSCEQQSLNQLQMCEDYDEMIKDLSQKEEQLLLNLSNTVKQNSLLLQDLSRKSVSIANTLIPRNPIPPKQGPRLPSHSMFAYNKKDRVDVRMEYQQKLFERLQRAEQNTPL